MLLVMWSVTLKLIDDKTGKRQKNLLEHESAILMTFREKNESGALHNSAQVKYVVSVSYERISVQCPTWVYPQAEDQLNTIFFNKFPKP